MANRRAGQTGQIDFQGRSHEAADCGTYRLVRNVGPSTWEVEWIAPCCIASDAELGLPAGRTSRLQFISQEAYARYF